ncbi:MAG TPA: thioesterase family protein [Bacteroidota bacterium]
MTVKHPTDKSLFKHTIELKVRNYEVDWQGIVHNAVYLQYFEIGRVEYLKHMGATLDLNSVRGKSKVVLVRNEIDYLRPIAFDEHLQVFTRISSIRNTSFVMEGLLLRSGSGEPVAANVAYHVWLNPDTDKAMQVPDTFRKLIQNFEGDRCAIQWPARTV